jgi:hypothetical protein
MDFDTITSEYILQLSLGIRVDLVILDFVNSILRFRLRV